MFTHIPYEVPQLTRIDSDAGRLYEVPGGNKYPSVTSVVGILNKESILQWRQEVGDKEANRVSAAASKRGTKMHSLCESYLKNEEVSQSEPNYELFDSIRPFLNKIDNIRCLETQLYSDYLQVAGTVDCIANYDGKLSVIDFKSSSKVKKWEYIHGYFLQTAAYAVMFEERTKTPVKNLVIMIAVENNPPMVFIEHRDDWIKKFIRVRKIYLEDYGK